MMDEALQLIQYIDVDEGKYSRRKTFYFSIYLFFAFNMCITLFVLH